MARGLIASQREVDKVLAESRVDSGILRTRFHLIVVDCISMPSDPFSWGFPTWCVRKKYGANYWYVKRLASQCKEDRSQMWEFFWSNIQHDLLLNL